MATVGDVRSRGVAVRICSSIKSCTAYNAVQCLKMPNFSGVSVTEQKKSFTYTIPTENYTPPGLGSVADKPLYDTLFFVPLLIDL